MLPTNWYVVSKSDLGVFWLDSFLFVENKMVFDGGCLNSFPDE